MTTRSDDMTGATVELLQALIRNECVNDGTPESGHETRNAELLGGFLDGCGGVEQFMQPAVRSHYRLEELWNTAPAARKAARPE